MSDTTEDVEAPYSASFKTSPGYEAAQLTVRGNTAEELLDRLDELNEKGGFQAIVDFNNNFQAVNTASVPDEDEKEEKPARGRSSSSKGGSRGGSSRGGSNRGGSRGNSRGNDRSNSRSEIDEEDLHPEGLTCDKRGCDGRVHYKKIENNRGTYELWVCEFQRSKGDGHFSEFIND